MTRPTARGNIIAKRLVNLKLVVDGFKAGSTQLKPFTLTAAVGG